MLTVNLWPICTDRGIYSFREQPGATPVAVRVPEGSVLREVRGMGLGMSVLLFVPSEWDKLCYGGWPANAVWREAKPGGRFALVKTKGRERVTG